ncbi:hypothetical protein MVEN_00294900 [Mycena venus]|uniref:Vacuolar protein 8 n=1 Tax=Mycena venus TaxID=2733690 RepID=A0A8H7DBR8_9AGAR|nr:hypothetical protein MVEN_00294900 [Mycena venus]
MPQLVRQQSHESIYSEWSDSKSPGPTINIHAIAKPLMRLMYHQQATKFMKKHRDVPLSSKSAEICLSWLEYKYVGNSTRTKILKYIAGKDMIDSDAHEVARTLLLDSVVIDQFLRASDAQLQVYACDLLVNLAINISSAPVVVQLNPCGRLVSFLRGTNIKLTTRALDALKVGDMCKNPSTTLVSLVRGQDHSIAQAATAVLAYMACEAEGAKIVIEARILDELDMVINLPEQKMTCWLLDTLTRHESTTGFVLAINPCQHIVGLLRDENVAGDALVALESISQSVEGARAVLRAGALHALPALLESTNAAVREETWNLIRALAANAPAGDVWQEGQCESLMQLIYDEEKPAVTVAAIYALADIANHADGAAALIDAGGFQVVDSLLGSSHNGTRGAACNLLAKLTSHDSIATATANTNCLQRIITLLGDPDVVVVEEAIRALASDDVPAVADNAVYALAKITVRADGAAAVVEAGALEILDELVQSPIPGMRRWACVMVGNLMQHENTFLALMDLNPGRRIVALLQDPNVLVVGEAVRALALITSRTAYAHALVDSGALQHVDDLLKSSESSVRWWTCNLIGNLANFEETASIAWNENRCCRRLVELTHSDVPTVADNAVYALSKIAVRTDGAAAVVEAGALEILDELVQSPIPGVRWWACTMIGNLTQHESTFLVLTDLNPGPRIVALLQDPNVLVVGEAVRALALIASRTTYAHAVLDSDALQHVDDLLKSSESSVRWWTCNLIGNLANFEETASIAWNENRCCRRLVELTHSDVPAVADNAVYALSKIAVWADGAAAIVEAGALEILDELVQSPIPGVRRWACAMVGNLTQHESTFLVLMDLNPDHRIVAFLQDPNVLVVGEAVRALALITSRTAYAHAVLESDALQHVDDLLKSSESSVRWWTCNLIGNLANFEETASIAWNENRCCRRLVELTHSDVPTVADNAVYALSKIAVRTDGAAAVVEAGALEILDELVQSPIPGVRRWACAMVGNLMHHESTFLVLMDLNPGRRIVALLQDPNVLVVGEAVRALALIASRTTYAHAVLNSDALQHVDDLLESDDVPAVADNAVYALAMTTYWAEGSTAVVKAEALQLLDELLQSSISGVRRWACTMARNMAHHKSTVLLLMDLNPGRWIVALLQDPNVVVVEEAVRALVSIACWPAGALAMVDSGALQQLDELLVSSESSVRGCTCNLIGNLAMFGEIEMAVWTESRCRRLLELSRDDVPAVADNAAYALSKIAFWADGAAAVVEAGALQFLNELIQSPISEVRRRACDMVGNLACHENSALVLLDLNPCGQIVTLLQDPDITVHRNALDALVSIACWPAGVLALVDSGALQQIDKLLESTESDVRKWTCNLIGNLAHFKETISIVWNKNRCRRLLELSRDEGPAVAGNAVYALSKIAFWPDGAAAVVDAGALRLLDELMQFTIPAVRRWTRVLLGNLAGHESFCDALLDTNPCGRLLESLRSSDEDPLVIDASAFALSGIARSAQGAKAVIEAGALDLLDKLLEHPHDYVRGYTCILLGELASFESSLDAVLNANSCTGLVSSSDINVPFCSVALFALVRLSKWPKGAVAIAKTNFLDHVPELLESPDPRLPVYTCLILACLPRNKPTPRPPRLRVPTQEAVLYSWGILVAFVCLFEVLGLVWI